VRLGECHSPLDQDRFDGLFRGLLRIKTQVFVEDLRQGAIGFGPSKIASGATEPFQWVGRIAPA